MSKFDRKKIAVTLAFASLFGNKTSATNSNINTKSANKSGFSAEKNSKSGAEIPKPLGTLNVRNDSSGNKIFNWVKNHKAVSMVAPLLIVGAVGLTILGVKHKSKDNQNPDEQNPGGPKSNEQDKQDPNEKKDNEQKPPIKDNANPPKPATQTQTYSEPKITSGLQNNAVADLILSEQGIDKQFVGDCIGTQNVDKFILALSRARNSGVRLLSNYTRALLGHLKTLFPKIIADKQLQEYTPLADLKKQDNVDLYFTIMPGNNYITFGVIMGDVSYQINDFNTQHQLIKRYVKFSSNGFQPSGTITIKDNSLNYCGA